MKKITKGREPDSLAYHRQQQYAGYDNYEDKDTLRGYLVRDQRGICCYCMCTILPSSGSMKIEHWECQENFPGKQLDYSNLLGACKGNEGQPEHLQHCDTFKGNKRLSKNPCNSLHNIEATIHYLGDGRITSTDDFFNSELNKVLNLNAPFLVNARKGALDAFKQALIKRGTLSKDTISRWLNTWNGGDTRNTDTLRPYCQVIVYWLDKRLKKDINLPKKPKK